MAQTFSFEIMDKDTRQPVSFAHIQLENELIGTVTDLNGRGTITIAEQFRDKPIVISFVGYSTLFLSIRQLEISKTNRYYLEVSPTELDEIQVIDIGMSPTDFINKALGQIEETFEVNKYRSVGNYQEQIIEDGDSTFSYDINLMIESEGFRDAMRKNKFVENDQAYLMKIHSKTGQQKYNLLMAAKMIGFELPYGGGGIEEDSFISDFFVFKNAIEQRAFIVNREVSSSDWYFEKLEHQDERTIIKLTNSGASGYFFSYWIDRNSFEINSIEGFIPFDTTKNSSPMASYHPGSIGFRIDYFQIEGLSYLKQLVIERESLIGTNPILGRKFIYGRLLIDNLTDQKVDKKAKIDYKFVQDYLR
jgi:hypothetical protein